MNSSTNLEPSNLQRIFNLQSPGSVATLQIATPRFRRQPATCNLRTFNVNESAIFNRRFDIPAPLADNARVTPLTNTSLEEDGCDPFDS